MPDLDKARLAIAGQFTEALRSVLGTMISGQSQVTARAADTRQPMEPDDWVWWSLVFSLAPESPLVVGSASSSWHSFGNAVLQGLGIDSASGDEIESTCKDVVNQVGSVVAQWLSEQQGAAVVCREAARIDAGEGASCAVDVLLPGAEGAIELAIGISQRLAEASSPKASAQSAWTAPLLSSIRLPIDVVLGRVTLQLSDVFKLDVGSVVDLERHIAEPAEIIVNGRVFAWGHVVISAGNYGVKIAGKAKSW